MQGTNPLTGQCAYITPCGWCARQNRECDIKNAKKRKKQYGDLFKSPKDSDLEKIEDGCGLVLTDLHSTVSSGIRKENTK